MENIQSIIGKVIGDLEKKRGHAAHDIQAFWDSLFEKGDQGHSRIAEQTKDKLIIHVDSSARLFKLSSEKTKILRLIQGTYPDIKSVYFKIGKVQ